MAKRTIEIRRRGFFGWIFLLMFWGFNALMLFSLFSGLSNVAERRGTLRTAAEQAGHDIGVGIGVTWMLAVWVAGAVILGLFCLLTRGRSEFVEVER